ncbi:MAG: hypothetical protein AAB862_00545, partial [Patescibacteria group bacterium]
MNKKIIILGAVILAVGGVIFYKNINTFDPSVDTRTFKTAGEFENYYKNLDEVYKKDTYGGATPEETLALFIDALKKGDTDLAAKYFVPEKQKQEAEDLRIGKEKGNLDFLIGYLGKAKLGKKFSENQYRLTV